MQLIYNIGLLATPTGDHAHQPRFYGKETSLTNRDFMAKGLCSLTEILWQKDFAL